MHKKREYCGGKTTEIVLGKITLYYSFDTLVAFKDADRLTALVIMKNYWGRTTGKHLNAINGEKAIRVTDEEFDKAYDKMLLAHKLNY